MTEMDEYLKMAFIQILADEWKILCAKCAKAKTLEDAYNHYQDYEIKIYNFTNYIRLHINGRKEEIL